MAKRQGISKKVRFEVFKRDKFTCQYCGRSAPDVILQIDHIEPVAAGGSDSIVNLLTSCFDCNSGKSDRKLSDDSAIKKAKFQLDELQERKSQIEMMAQWQRELANLDSDEFLQVDAFWEEMSEGWETNEKGEQTLRKLVKRFGMAEVMEGIRMASVQYLRDSSGKVTQSTAENAFNKIGGICFIRQRAKSDPDAIESYRLCSAVTRTYSWAKKWVVMEHISRCRQRDVSFDEMHNILRKSGNWSEWQDLMNVAGTDV